MVFDGLGTDLENFPDLLRVLAFGNQQKNLALPDRQRFQQTLLAGNSIWSDVFEKSRGDFRAQVNSIVNDILQDGFELLGARLGLLGAGFSFFCARLRLFGAGFRLFRARLRRFGAGLGLLGARLGLFRPGLRLLNPRLFAGHARRLNFFSHFLSPK